MALVAGASRYYNAALYGNQQGSVMTTPNLLSDSMGAVDLLDIGRQDNGIGLSASARALNKQFLEQTSNGFNTIFSLSTYQMTSTDTMKQQIEALRARLPDSKIADYVRGDNVDEEV